MAKHIVKKSLALALTAAIGGMTFICNVPEASAESPTNVGLAAHALRAYREGWQYVWGGTSYGAVDCSGLIASYYGVGGVRCDMLASSYEWGYVSNGVPNIHGLGLHQPGHIGVYLCSGMAVDARDVGIGMVYQNVYTKGWAEWFKVAGVSYPDTGWVLFDGDSFYYENGEYIVNTSRTFDGVTYTFDSAGVSDTNPPEDAYEATDYSYISDHGSSYSYYDDDEDEDEDDTYYYDDDEDEDEDDEAEKQAEEERLRREAEAEAQRQREEQERLEKEEAERKAKEEAERKAKEEAERKAKEEAERKAKEEAEKKAKEEAAKKAKAEADKKARLEAEKKIAEERQKAEDNAVIAEYDYEDTEDSKTVAAIQTRLYELGYLTKKATGYFGEDTVDAVMIFQSNNDLEVTGIVTAKTYKVLKSNKAKNDFDLLAEGSFDIGASLSVTALQERLAELKYYYDEITGFYGELTSSAVKLFQKNNDLEATGDADPDTQLKVFSADAIANPNAGGLSYGECGALVGKLQKRLIELRFLSAVATDKFDDATLEAVHSYQAAAGLKEDDKLTAAQLEVLYSDDAVKVADFSTMKFGFSGEDVAQLQSRLASLKYYDGKTSGVYSKSVVSAVESFQKDFGLEVTGVADEATQETIKTEAQRENAHVGEQLIMKTATISDHALANAAKDQTAEIVLNAANEQTDLTRMLVIIGSVFTLVLLAAIVIVKETKKKAAAKQSSHKK